MSRARSVKQAVRSRIAHCRQRMSPSETRRRSALIVQRLRGMPELLTTDRICFYRALLGEVDVDRLIDEAFVRGQNVAIPIWRKRTRDYRWGRVTSRTRYRLGVFGIREPDGRVAGLSSAPQTVVVPGVAFDRRGQRIGRGGGFYDRLLAPLPDTRRIGVAFDFQLYDALPLEAWDAPMDVVVTESTILRIRKRKHGRAIPV